MSQSRPLLVGILAVAVVAAFAVMTRHLPSTPLYAVREIAAGLKSCDVIRLTARLDEAALAASAVDQVFAAPARFSAFGMTPLASLAPWLAERLKPFATTNLRHGLRQYVEDCGLFSPPARLGVDPRPLAYSAVDRLLTPVAAVLKRPAGAELVAVAALALFDSPVTALRSGEEGDRVKLLLPLPPPANSLTLAAEFAKQDQTWRLVRIGGLADAAAVAVP